MRINFLQEGKPGHVSRDDGRWDGQQLFLQAPLETEGQPGWRERGTRTETTEPIAGERLGWQVEGGGKPAPFDAVAVVFLALA